MRRETCDVLIVGGGINGAGIARDLALRARKAGAKLRIALIEQHHFASGASGNNSQLIHGGLRYLKQLEFGLVREALQERTTLLHIAPHLVEPMPFLIPFHGSARRAYYGIGLWLYSQLAGRRGIGPHQSVSREELERLEPGLAVDGVSSAAIYYDCKVNAARLVLENLFDAIGHGAMAANYTRFDQLAREDS
ncbi:MAG: FAD-dependent oxidoreductase, partial [bacterium]|nr:FAD-dependent oxidoreductase [bacterium]